MDMAPNQPTERNTKLDQATAKLERAKHNRRQFPLKQEAIDKEVKELQQRLLWLDTLRKLNGGQYNDWLSSVYKRSIVPYCQTWNVQFAEYMQTRLPVEMRNLVYHHLWDKETINAFPDLSRVAGGSKCLGERCRCTKPHGIPLLPHFVKPAFMGHTTSREIVRALYDAFHSRDEQLTIRAPEHIKTAVSKDVFNVGLDPSLHLRSLAIRIKLDRLRRPRPPHHCTKDCTHTDAEKVYTNGFELKAWTKALLSIKYKSKFELTIALFQRNIRMAVIEEVLLNLANIRQILQAHNAKVTIEWLYRGHWEKGIESADDDWVFEFMDDFYALPRRDWRSSMLTTLVVMDEAGVFQEKHTRFYKEPCEHLADRDFVHAMWEPSEDEDTTDGEEEDEEHIETSNGDECGDDDENDKDDDEGDDSFRTRREYKDLTAQGTASETSEDEDE